jgi:capsular polysaccharide biosynthesis protein
MFQSGGRERERDGESGSTGFTPREGTAFEMRRVRQAVRARRTRFFSVLMTSAAIGLLVGKFVVSKTYTATASIQYIPQRGDGMSVAESAMPTLIESVTLPSNILRIMDKLGKLDAPVEVVAGGISVSSPDGSSVMSITAKGKSPDEATELANTTAEVFVTERRDVMKRHLVTVVSALRTMLSQREASVAAARARYDRFRDDNNIKVLSLQEEESIKELARLETTEHDVRISLVAARGQEKSLEEQQAANPTSVVSTQGEQLIDNQKLAQLESELVQARARFPDNHPAVVALTEQVAALKTAAAKTAPTVTTQTVTRSLLHDQIASQLEENQASLSALEDKRRELKNVHDEEDARARLLTRGEAEAARLLAEVQVDEEDVGSLLKQIAAADEDVRGAASDFQMVSLAIPPTHAATPVGPLTAIAIPLVIELWLLWWWVAPLMTKTPREVTFWTRLPVLWSASWPYGPRQEAEELARELAHAIEGRSGGVIGFSAMRDESMGRELAQEVAERLRMRGVSCAILESPEPEPGVTMAHALERSEVGEQLEELRAEHGIVLFALPSVEDREAVRAARRWIDAMLIIVPSGEHSVGEMAKLRRTLGLGVEGVALALVGCEGELLTDASRTAGDAASFWGREPRGAT